LPDLYGAIQMGRYAEDTRRAVDWMRANCHVEDVVLGGLCGGGITAVFAAVGSPHVKGIFALGLPVVVDGSNVDQTANMSVGQLEGIRNKYLKKLVSPSAWLRLLTMRSDFRLVIASLIAPLRRQKAKANRGARDRLDTAVPPRGNANPHFPGAFERVLRQGCPVLLLFSESDRLYAEFREKFLEDHGHLVEAHAGLVEVDVVPQANHVFTFAEWQHDMLGRVRSWMQRRYPGEARAAENAPTALEAVLVGRASSSRMFRR
jgi:dienelactone hydrolase